MKDNFENSNKNITKKKKIFFVVVTLLLELVIIFSVGEILLRFVPIPGVEFESWTFDNVTGTVLYPGSRLTYRNDRGDYVERKANSLGYLDYDHEKKKPDGVMRIGFFGDSFTEARQVTLESTFFRLIEKDLKDYNVETLSFGIQCYSTLQEYLTSKKYTDFFDLDLVVYVFYENDPANNIKISRLTYIPYAVSGDNGFEIDNSFRESTKFKNRWYYKIGDYLDANSLLISTINKRIRLFLRFGVKTEITYRERAMAAKYENRESKRPLDALDLPSTWPDDLKDYAIEIAESIILKWKKEVEDQGREFVILYVPRETEWKKETKDQDSWKPWLEKFCEKNKIIFIDPTEEFFLMDKEGEELYYDHLTVGGNRTFANSFIKWFKNYRAKEN